MDDILRDTFETVQDFERALKKWRLGDSGWIMYRGKVAGKLVELKTYRHTYMQIFRADGFNKNLAPMDCSVKQFNEAIAKGLA